MKLTPNEKKAIVISLKNVAKNTAVNILCRVGIAALVKNNPRFGFDGVSLNDFGYLTATMLKSTKNTYQKTIGWIRKFH